MLTLHHLCTITLAQTVTPTLTAAEESALRNSAAPPQDTVLWLSKGLINIHFSQVQLNNWAAGGQSNLLLLTKFDRYTITLWEMKSIAIVFIIYKFLL